MVEGRFKVVKEMLTGCDAPPPPAEGETEPGPGSTSTGKPVGAISRATRASTRAAATGALTMTNAPAEAGEGGRSVEGTATKRPRPGFSPPGRR